MNKIWARLFHWLGVNTGLASQTETPPSSLSGPRWNAAPAAELLAALHKEALLRPYLGIGECKTLLNALGSGIGLDDRPQFDLLFTALLIKNKADGDTISRTIEGFFQKRNAEISLEIEAALRQLEAKKEAAQKATGKQTSNNTVPPPVPQPAPLPSATGSGTGSSASPVYETSVQVEIMLSPSTFSLPASERFKTADTNIAAQPPQGHRFILTDDYQPVSRRQMEQIWRFLRKPSRTGSRAEKIDLPRTIERFARQGWLDQPEWQRDRLNKVHLVLLIDHSSSMLAWNLLGRQLIAAAIQGGGHSRAEVFWFSNLPLQFESATKPGLLFKDTAHLKTEKLENLLRRSSKQDTEVLIFSDGGAARGGLNEERAKRTDVWLQLLKKNVSSVSWLNPMPKTRWWGSTAEWTHHQVAMFEADQRGLMAAINHLRGR